MMAVQVIILGVHPFVPLTLLMLRLFSSTEQHVNPVMLVFIRKLSLRTLRCVAMCQGFCHFKDFLRHFVCAKLATYSIRVNPGGVGD